MDEERRGQKRGSREKAGGYSAVVVRYIDAHVNVY